MNSALDSKKRQLKGLYVITDRTLCGDTIVQKVEQALLGGAAIVQYRDKSGDLPRRRREAQALVRLCHRHQALLIINDDIQLAKTVAADGVHLGREDGDLEEARTLLGPDAIIGLSCYDQFDRALQAQTQGADYIAFGRFFPSHSKPTAVQADKALLERGKRELNIPMVAIGGITPENGPPLISAGAHMLAVIHAVFGSRDTTAACRAFTPLFNPEDL